MKVLLVALALITTMGSSSVYDFKMNSIDGKLIDFSQYKGKNSSYRECGIQVRVYTAVQGASATSRKLWSENHYSWIPRE